MSGARWRTSSYSGGNNECVETVLPAVGERARRHPRRRMERRRRVVRAIRPASGSPHRGSAPHW
ncbi:DUF397 domain-containing protein [Streptomyces parvus]|uniref:DUF397 domain-containing protein n=1 Tax=Streptomyces parvus TaxID=66428 RepID=UPI0033F43E6E